MLPRWQSEFTLVLAIIACSLYPLHHVTALQSQQHGSHSPQPPECCPINESMLWRKSLPPGLTPSAAALIAPLYNYSFVTPRPYLAPSISYYGAARRLRRFVSDLLTSTRPLKVGLVGGSISRGVAAPGYLGFFHMFCNKYLTALAPGRITCRNGAIAGTPSAYMVMCHKYSVDPDADLMFAEYIVNDGLDDVIVHNRIVMTMERLMRVLLDLPAHPAVVLIQSTWNMTTNPSWAYTASSEFPEAADEVYYDAPTVSAHTPLVRLILMDRVPGFDHSVTFSGNHPRLLGHKVYCDLLVHLIQETALDLVHRPLSPSELLAHEPPLPDPIVPGNNPPSASSCMVGQDFEQLVTAAQGWAWVDEGPPGRPKWGYVAQEPGAALTFEVDTVRSHLPPGSWVSLTLLYLGSYSNMGTAVLECVAGCTCNATEVDAHLARRVSQTYPATFDVSQSPACQVRVTVSNRTSSGGHKFKVSGAVVKDLTGAADNVRPTSFMLGFKYVNPGAT